MDGQVAIATLSGKAYYTLVNEMKRRGMPFLSLKPTDPIPPYVKVVITTAEERIQICHPNVITYNEAMEDPVKIVDRATQVVHGKSSYRKVIVGVDPGKTFGVAVVCDDQVLKTEIYRSTKDVVNTIVNTLNEVEALEKIIRIGDGAEPYRRTLIRTLDRKLPSNVTLENVSEKDTTKVAKTLTSRRRGLLDAVSAVEIASRNGRRILRRG